MFNRQIAKAIAALGIWQSSGGGNNNNNNNDAAAADDDDDEKNKFGWCSLHGASCVQHQVHVAAGHELELDPHGHHRREVLIKQ